MKVERPFSSAAAFMNPFVSLDTWLIQQTRIFLARLEWIEVSSIKGLKWTARSSTGRQSCWFISCFEWEPICNTSKKIPCNVCVWNISRFAVLLFGPRWFIKTKKSLKSTDILVCWPIALHRWILREMFTQCLISNDLVFIAQSSTTALNI